MSLMIDPQLEQEIERRARIRGFEQPSDYLAELVRQEQSNENLTRPQQDNAARQWIENIRGTASGQLTTDQIMELSRSET